ncbi:hypothetical protein RN001_005172 [Aquatica leii]|uniref:Fanconi anemia group D2 protein n=1 Tax=Aquatica leii TaxID=1421715 RepID=A0AAN7QK24_9COLE|nr:hypothetical protein RN001_005172 [Aquatica leii]
MSGNTSPILSLSRHNVFASQKRKRDESELETSYFNEVLSEAGLTLQSDTNPNIITREQALVVRDISKTLQSHMSYPANIREFTNGLKTFCNKDESFKKALLPTELKKSNTSSLIQQDSVIRILLNVFCLQDEVIELLLKHVIDCAVVESNDTSLLRLLLNPLRYLAHINNSKIFTTKLVDILDIAVYVAQLEILNLIPEIIPDTEYEETAKQLSKLLDDNPDLTGAIVDCLNSLNLNNNIRSEIQQQVLAQLDATSSAKIFPILFEFVVEDCNSKDLQNVLLQVRNALDTILGEASNKKDVDTDKALIYNKLQTLTRARKTLFDGWLMLISNMRTHTVVKPIDIQILFMLHYIGKPRHSTIELLIRKRVKLGLFKVTHLESLFKNYLVTQTLKDYLNSIIEVANSLLRFYNEPILTEFSQIIFKCVFSHKLIERIQQQEIIYSLTLLTGMSDKKSVTPVLKVLRSLSEDEKMQQHVVHLMGLLEKLDGINLTDVKLVFELLCSLTCGEKCNESMSGLNDEIHMIIRKLLSSCKKLTKHRGIVAAIVMIKTLVSTTEDTNEPIDLDEPILIDDLPAGRTREAAALLDLTNTCTLGCPESVGLLYDELAHMIITSPNICQIFMVWLYQMFTNDFQNTFVVENVPEPINDIDVTMQFSLNADDEVETPISVNIAELTLKSQFYGHSSILILAPLFRLLRLIHYKQHDGNLSSIDALLGCPVILPQLSDINIYDTEQLKQVSDCIFHCINWIRELINAFVTQKNRNLKKKVLDRISDAIKLQEVLEECLENIPDHKLPSSYFDTFSQATKQLSTNTLVKVSKSKKAQKIPDVSTNFNETAASTSAVTQKPKTKATAKKKRDNIFKKECHFRELDTDILLLLRYPLQIDGDISIASTQIPESQMNTININQFKFLMSDFVRKLNTLIKGKDLGLSHITMIKIEDLITDCVKLLSSVKKHLKTVTSALKELVESADGCLDSEQLYSNYAKQLKEGFGFIIECYSLIFGWSGFQHPKNLNLLKGCLKALIDDEETLLISSKGLTLEFTKNLLENVDYCLSLPTAVNLIIILQALYVINPNPELKKQIATTSGKLLSRKWYNDKKSSEVGKDAFLNTNELIKAYLSNATSKTICGLIGTLQEQASNLKTKEDSLEMLVSISSANFHIFYKNLCITLLEIIRSEITSLTNDEHLSLWKFTALSMQGLMTIVKTHETKVNLTSYLKNCIGILKVFLSNGIPILEIMLQSKPTEVLEIFKMIQASTRFLHHICCYSKFKKDVSLMSYVPQFRQVLESLLYRVKATLVANNCSDAFWMGTLKNKNLQGEEILSQSSVRSDDDMSVAVDNEDLPSDDSGDDGQDVVDSDNDSTSSIVV